ncbi:hypothetical protein BDF21DRAFT_497941 [Thamnidium elegans]|nr:hypothetical protein BDF21DRAFT_497941 [Thamnidium elegans]
MRWKIQLRKDQFKKNKRKSIYSCQHNHVIGSFEDMKHLTLSSALKELTESQLSLGYDKRDVLVSLQKRFSQSATSTHPDHFVHADEIYNIYRKIQQQ